MARDVDMLLVIMPGGRGDHEPDQRRKSSRRSVRDGILINMARGSVVDEAALIKALQDKTILTAGLDVFASEPKVPTELIAMEHVVLLPHLGSATVATRDKMDQLVVDNLTAWAAGKPPFTPPPVQSPISVGSRPCATQSRGSSVRAEALRQPTL